MARTPSTMLELGTIAPDFSLPDTAGQVFHLDRQNIKKGLLVIFMCNHCPFVIHIRSVLAKKVMEYQDLGINVVAINSNDYQKYPDDSPEQMLRDVQKYNYSFPYLLDEEQLVAKAYRAACTPDFFLFNGEKRLVYRGQFDASRPGNTVPVSGVDLGAAVTSLAGGFDISEEQKPSLGCSIKWKEGNEPEYFSF